jgi:hypothetical protein
MSDLQKPRHISTLSSSEAFRMSVESVTATEMKVGEACATVLPAPLREEEPDYGPP